MRNYNLKQCPASTPTQTNGMIYCKVSAATVKEKIVCAGCQATWISLSPPEKKCDNTYLSRVFGGCDKPDAVSRSALVLPSISALISNFTMAIAEWISVGAPVTTKEEFESRKRLCDDCPHWKNNQCSVCGCGGIKLFLKTEKCPIGRW